LQNPITFRMLNPNRAFTARVPVRRIERVRLKEPR
jgi:hypothetical protein